jgi:hypothetical protein
MNNNAPLAVETLLSHEALGAVSVYRVIDVRDDLVGVEAVDVPGLTRGFRLRIGRKAAGAMRVLSTDAVRASGAPASASLRLAASPAGL